MESGPDEVPASRNRRDLLWNVRLPADHAVRSDRAAVGHVAEGAQEADSIRFGDGVDVLERRRRGGL